MTDAKLDERQEAAAKRRVWAFAVFVFILVAAGAGLAVARHMGVFGQSDAGESGPRGGDKTMAVRVAPITKGSLALYLKYPGELTADAANLSFKVGGRIEEVVPRIGDEVKQGDVLARVDARTLKLERKAAETAISLAKAKKAQAEAQLSLARRELERTLPLAEKKLVAEQAVDQLKANVEALEAEAQVGVSEVEQGKDQVALATQQIADAKLIAPFDGVITERYLDPGALVQPGSQVLRLVAVGSLRVKFRIPERDLGSVAPNQKISLNVQATGDKVYGGHVTRIAGEVSKTDRSAAAEAALDETSPILKSGMYTEITIDEKTLNDVLLVPAAAVLTRPEADGSETTGVLVLDGDTARWKPVQVLGRSEELTAVSGELKAGQPVMTLGHEQLSDGAKVMVAGGGQNGTKPERRP